MTLIPPLLGSSKTCNEKLSMIMNNCPSCASHAILYHVSHLMIYFVIHASVAFPIFRTAQSAE